MPTFVRSGGVWRQTTQNNVRISGTWKNCTTFVRHAGAWRLVFQATLNNTPTIVNSPTMRVAGLNGTLYTVDTQNANIWNLHVDPNNSAYLYQSGSAVNLQRSTNGATSWTQVINVPTGQMEFYYSGGGRIYTSQNNGGSTVYRSTDYGASWTSLGGFGGIGGGSVATAFNNADRLVAEGGNQSNVNYYTSNATAASVNWTSTSSGDNHMMEGTHNYVCRSTNWADTGVYYSTSWPPSWTISKLSGSNITTGWYVASPRDATSIGFMINSWSAGSFCYSSDNMANFTAQTNPPGSCRMGAWGNFVYVLTNSGNLWKSTDRGSNFVLVDDLSSFIGTSVSTNLGNGYGLSVSGNGKHCLFMWNGWKCIYSMP